MSHQMQQSEDFSLFQLGNAKTFSHTVNQGQKERVGRPGFLCKLCFFPSHGQNRLPCSAPATFLKNVRKHGLQSQEYLAPAVSSASLSLTSQQPPSFTTLALLQSTPGPLNMPFPLFGTLFLVFQLKTHLNPFFTTPT